MKRNLNFFMNEKNEGFPLKLGCIKTNKTFCSERGKVQRDTNFEPCMAFSLMFH